MRGVWRGIGDGSKELAIVGDLREHPTVSNSYTICDADGEELDARFFVQMVDRHPTVVIESSGAGKASRNPDYDEALQLILQRLKDAQAVLQRVEVDSSYAADLAPGERLVRIVGYQVPVVLSVVEDVEHLRKKIAGGAAKTARKPGAKGSGNPRKRLRLFLVFTKGWRPSEEELAAVVRWGDGVAPRVSQPSVAEDAPTARRRSGTGRSGQGFEPDPAVRKAVEEYAIGVATEFYEGRDWKVKRVDQEKLGYDLCCVSGSRTLFVEVKGTRTAGERVVITANEAFHAHEHSEDTELFVLYNIQVDRTVPKEPRCFGGEQRVISDWDPHATGSLVPKVYYWHLPR